MCGAIDLHRWETSMLPTISKAFFLIPVALLFLTPHPATAQAGPQAPQLRVPCGYRTAEGGRLISAEYFFRITQGSY
jgi:hypothetical protein